MRYSEKLIEKKLREKIKQMGRHLNWKVSISPVARRMVLMPEGYTSWRQEHGRQAS